MLELKKNKESIWVKKRIRYENIVFLIPFIGMMFCTTLSIFSKRIRITINHSIVYMFSTFGGGAIMYIMLSLGAESNFITMSLFLIILITLWIIIPMILTYSLIYYTDVYYILEKMDQGYYSDRVTRDDILSNTDKLFRQFKN